MQIAYRPTAPPALARVAKAWHARLAVWASRPRFRKLYPALALMVLLGTTGLWAWLGARVQAGNADQLSDPYLFSDWATFHGAIFPSSHTFLLKWPIFLLLRLFGITPLNLEISTVAVVVLTVGCLAAVLHKIERRPYIFGTICLGLSLALLLIPSQPYAAGILPVNMAMLTTRNLEYIVFILVLVLFVRSTRFRSYTFVAGTLLLGLLIASDKLFLGISGGGALIGLVGYALVRNWAYVTLSARWLVGTLAAAVGSSLLLLVITTTHLTHLTQANTSPYTLALGLKALALGISYGILGIFTNVGANPVYDSTQLAQLPIQLMHRLASLSGLAYLLAIGLLIYVLLLVVRQLKPTLHVLPRRAAKQTAAAQLSIMLILSTAAAWGMFVAADHYYAVDARYLGVATFTFPILVAAALRKQKFRAEKVVSFGMLLLVGVGVAVTASIGRYNHQQAALADTNEHNYLVSQALHQHKTNVLVGDYWRVLPTKLVSTDKIRVVPLGNCTLAVVSLTSAVWQPNLARTRFAYLVSLDRSLTNFPRCSLPEITAQYGRPNATQVIAGTLAKPKEVLLFYDRGSHPVRAARSTHETAHASILPVEADQLMGTNCSVPTIMTIVAHQDDDLLFTSPDLLHDIHAGHCMRTIFLTAGDSGNGRFYWLNRQLGSETAYDAMLGHKAIWQQRTVKLSAHGYVTVASPDNNPKVSLIFFNLPDGGLHGEGFPVSADESLAKLLAGRLQYLQAVDGQSLYASDELVGALSSLMNIYQPAEVRTQASVPSDQYPDHSDHIAAGMFTELAIHQYDQTHFGGAIAIPLKRYIGYPIHGYASNITGADLAQKEAAFLAYAQYDGGVCHSVQQCAATPTYGAYLSRQYQADTPD